MQQPLEFYTNQKLIFELELSKLKNIISKIPTDNTERTSLINEKIKIYDII